MKTAATPLLALFLAIPAVPPALAALPVSPNVYISEIDADQPAPGVTRFIELSTRMGMFGTSLDGYFLVLVNGANDKTYRTIPLTGKKIGSSGYFVIGQSSVVSQMPDPAAYAVLPVTLQNGSDVAGAAEGDAVVLCAGNPASIPNNTPVASIATLTTIIDAIVYDGGLTKSGDDMGLLNGLGIADRGMVWDPALAPVAGGPTAPVCVGRPEQGGPGNNFWIPPAARPLPMPAATPGWQNSTLYDVWATGKSLTGGLDGDPDNDGLSNLTEYFAGTDPVVPNADTTTVSRAPDGSMVMTFTMGEIASLDATALVMGGSWSRVRMGGSLPGGDYAQSVNVTGGADNPPGRVVCTAPIPSDRQRQFARFLFIYPAF